MAEPMKKISYGGYRFPPEIIHQAIWLHLRFTLSFRDVEDLSADCGDHGLVRDDPALANHFGPIIAAERIFATSNRLRWPHAEKPASPPNPRRFFLEGCPRPRQL
jgi:hypothetical protein